MKPEGVYAPSLMFRKVLIANRGEIAIRIATTLRRMGIQAAALFSDADQASLYLAGMDEAHRLEGQSAAETYLQGEKIIALAKRIGADAIHPGYGFLSESAAFARMCADAGIKFIGPSPEAVHLAGNKVEAKRALEAAGIPVVPGWIGEADDASGLRREAKRIGYPILIKAAAGGGGRGMRVVSQERELLDAVSSAEREARLAFGDGRIFLEKLVEPARHVEIQILADEHGNVVHLLERECSVQRRHQKLIEESPSTAVGPDLRMRMGEAAIRAARVVGYSNAGTVEFLIDRTGNFYFLEVNTRLQVEHSVTEMLLGLDLVELQVRVAAGEKLPVTQEGLHPRGHALECRICAEDPARQFLPSTGTIAKWRLPVAPFVRVDSGVEEGSEVSIHYDSLLAKLIVWGQDRTDAIARMAWALRNFVVLGVTTNVEYLAMLVDTEEFKAGRVHTRFVEEHPFAPERTEDYVAALLASMESGPASGPSAEGPSDPRRTPAGPWERAGTWRAV